MRRAESCEKPPYRIPTMAEARDAPDLGLTLVSTFTGAGGSCLGFRMAGYRTLWASEFIAAARDTYAANFPDVPIDERDIRDVTAKQVLRAAGVKKGELDVLEGSPPCASFSMAGKRARHWGEVRPYSETRQRTDDLFWEFGRLLDGVRPRCFVAENVPSMARGVAKGYFLDILAMLKGCGYRVEARILDAQWLGVPQRRQRLFFVGVREDLGLDPAFPEPLPYRYSVRDAVPWIARAKYNRRWRQADEPSTVVQASQSRHPPTSKHGTELAEVEWGRQGGNFGKRGDVIPIDGPLPTVQATQGGGEFRVVEHPWRDAGEDHREVDPEGPAPTVMQHDRGRVQMQLSPEDLTGTAIGEEADRLIEGEQSKRYHNLIRSETEEPSPTVTQTGRVRGAASVIHPTERRKFTIAELRRICAFPDDFVLTGTFAQQWERLGRAVPPPVARAVAVALRDGVLTKLSRRGRQPRAR